MENKNIEIKGKGIKVHVLSTIFIVLGVLIMAGSILVLRKIYSKYDDMHDSYRYIEQKRESALIFQRASDYLTEQSRQYVATGDIACVENYFNEKNEIKNREAALARIEADYTLELEESLLGDAMDRSEALVVYEIHAMRLAAEAYGEDISAFTELKDYALPQEELAKSNAEQKLLALQYLFGGVYADYKERINWDINNATVLIEEDLGAQYRENDDELIRAMNLASMLLFTMFLLLVLIFIFNMLLMVKPADRFVKALNNREKLPEIGGYEFRKFARRYNNIFREDQRNLSLLEEQGEIDTLTGTLKVSTLELIKHKLTDNKEPLGIMMVDIDNFRSIKETNGYDVADKVVEKVAKQFASKFKASDYTVRLSQDEFEIFMLRMQSCDAEMITERIRKINEKLAVAEEGIPAVSVSVGVAFSENGYTNDVERKADMALNSVKENGRGTCKIAED